MQVIRSSLIKLLPFLIIVVIAGCSTALNPSNPVKFSKYNGQQGNLLGISMKYPSDWTAKEVDYGKAGFWAVFTAPNSSNSSFNDNVQISIGESVAGNNLSAYTQFNLKLISKTGVIVDSSDTTLSGYPAHKIVYRPYNLDKEFMRVYTIKDNKVYQIDFYVSKPLTSYSDSFNEMIESFKIP